MNARTNKENGTVNAQVALETKVVDTVDYRSSAGQGQEQRHVHVTHQLHPSEDSTTTSGGVLAGAAAAVSSTFQSAKDAISQK